MTDILLRPIVALQVAVHELREREDGQTTTEYAILLGFLAIAIIIALFFLQERSARASSPTQPAASRAHPAKQRRNRPSHLRRPRQQVCAGPVTPSTGPVHTLCVKGAIRPTTSTLSESARFGGTMRDDPTTSSCRPRGRETELMYQHPIVPIGAREDS